LKTVKQIPYYLTGSHITYLVWHLVWSNALWLLHRFTTREIPKVNSTACLPVMSDLKIVHSQNLLLWPQRSYLIKKTFLSLALSLSLSLSSFFLSFTHIYICQLLKTSNYEWNHEKCVAEVFKQSINSISISGSRWKMNVSLLNLN
jgi:hypothetical protein